jgi:prepilin-type N-terminal cleavage/methylation domain-containing protein
LSRGFTVVELLLVIVVISALTAVALPRFRISDFDRQLHAEAVFVGLRYAHQLAITSGCAVQVSVAADTSLSMGYTGDPDPCQAMAVNATGSAGPYLVASPGGVSSAGVPVTITFAASGQPDNGATLSIAGRSITVAEGTGHVY